MISDAGLHKTILGFIIIGVGRGFLFIERLLLFIVAMVTSRNYGYIHSKEFRSKQSGCGRSLRLCEMSCAVTYYMWKWQNHCLDKEGHDH